MFRFSSLFSERFHLKFRRESARLLYVLVQVPSFESKRFSVFLSERDRLRSAFSRFSFFPVSFIRSFFVRFFCHVARRNLTLLTYILTYLNF